MPAQLLEGQKLEKVIGPDGGADIYYDVLSKRSDLHDIDSITVQMENGQGAGVPWARVVKTNGDIRLVNLALVEEVVILVEDEKA